MALPFRLGRSLRPLSRHFHSSPAMAKLVSQAPSVRNSRPELGLDLSVKDKPLFNQYRAEMPRETFSSAIQSGYIMGDLDTIVAQAAHLLYAMHLTRASLPKAAIEALGTDPTTLARIALILRGLPGWDKVGKLALLRLAEAGEPVSVMGKAADQLNKSPSLQSKVILDHLRSLALQGTMPQAMVLYSFYLKKEALGFHGTRGQKALELLKEAYEISKPIPPNTGSSDFYLSEAVPPPWLAYADAMTSMGEHDAAIEAINVGVTKYDSPRAYERLADRMLQNIQTEEVDLFKYEEYLMKSAMAHNAESCYRLGTLYLTTHIKCDESDGAQFTPGSFERRYPPNSGINYRQALAWYELAAVDHHPRAGLVVAACMRYDGGFLEDAKPYLQLTEAEEDLQEKAQLLRQRWTDEDWDFELTNFIC